MIESTLTIRYCQSRQRETEAWFVPGSRTEDWLAELERWQVAMRDLVLRPLGVVGGDARLAGVLATVAGGQHPKASPRCQEYGLVADRVFLPVEARLDPQVRDSELADLLAGNDDDYVFHPTIGLVRIEQRQRLCVADLLRAPPHAETDWNWARTGATPLRPLVSVEPDESPSVDEILLDAKDDIATEDPKKAPWRRPSRKQSVESSTRDTGGGLLGGVFRALGAMFGAGLARVGRPPRSRAGDAARNKQLDRLLRLLSENPDEGLRYAMPLEGSAHRGIAPPGEELASRNVDFNLKRLGGGEPAGVWEVSWQRFENLRNSYRELANREMSLGRHRRAAYVFAHLLDDMHGAATALVKGGHWREAAILYRDRLDRPQVAAECLEKGRFWSEAIDAYRQLDAFEKVGDLCRGIGQNDEADEAYQRAVEHCLTTDDHLGAARLAEQKLDAPRDALRYLAAGWPNSSQAIACLNQMFSVFATRGQHEDAKRLVEQIDPDFLSEHMAMKAVSVLADVATRYPDLDLRELAADQARVATGQLLPDASKQQVKELVRDVRRLAPQDRLLARDCYRYQEASRVTERSKVSRVRLASRQSVWQLVWSFSLASDVVWTNAASSQTAAYVAGYQENLLVAARLPLSPLAAQRTAVSWPVSPALVGAPVLLCPDPHERARLLAQVMGDACETPAASFHMTDEFPNDQIVGPSHLLTARSRGVARSSDGLTWVVEQDDDELALRTYGPDEQLVSSHIVPLPQESAADNRVVTQHVPIAATCTHVYLAIRDYVLCIRRGTSVEAVRMKSRVLDILAPPGDYPTCVIVTCEREVVALWHEPTENRTELIDDTMPAAVCGCTRDGRVVLADGERFEVHARKQRHFELTAKAARRLEAPLAILPAQQPNHVLICCRDGKVELINLK